MKLSSPRWLSKKPSGAKPRWVKLSRVPPKRRDTIHSYFITSRHFRINRRLCKRLHSKVTEALQRVHQTLPSLCGSGLARETNHACVQSHRLHLRTRLRLPTLNQRGQWRGKDSASQEWDNWVHVLAKITIYVERALLLLWNSSNLRLAIFLQPTTTHTYYVRPCLLICISLMCKTNIVQMHIPSCPTKGYIPWYHVQGCWSQSGRDDTQ